jgi:hypothetical protein
VFAIAFAWTPSLQATFPGKYTRTARIFPSMTMFRTLVPLSLTARSMIECAAIEFHARNSFWRTA